MAWYYKKIIIKHGNMYYNDMNYTLKLVKNHIYIDKMYLIRYPLDVIMYTSMALVRLLPKIYYVTLYSM